MQILSLEHLGLIRSLCRELNLSLSEYNFSNLYLFRSVHKYTLEALDSEHHVIYGTSYKEQRFLMPLFSPNNWNELLEIGKQKKVDYIFPIPESSWKDISTEQYLLDYTTDESDYLYDITSIQTYKGRHFDGHRNIIRNLLSEYTIHISELTSKNSSDAAIVVHDWEQNQTDPGDAAACREGIEKFLTLGLQGFLFSIDEKPVGLLMGEPLTNEIYLIHFVKVNNRYRGLYQFIYQESSKRLPSNFRLLNWEQDLGLERLRHSKEAYRPYALLKKGRLWIKGR